MSIKSFDDLDNFIIDNNKVILLYFGATWCGPCKQLKKKLSESDTINEMPLLSYCYIDVDDNEDCLLLLKIFILSFKSLLITSFCISSDIFFGSSNNLTFSSNTNNLSNSVLTSL